MIRHLIALAGCTGPTRSGRRWFGSPEQRRHQSRAWRAGRLEALEGRALLSVAGLDPSFNGGQPVANLGTTAASPAAATTLNSGSAVAVQTDGKILVAGTIVQPTSLGYGATSGVQRYNADGTLDTTFGHGGEADLTLPAGTYAGVTTSTNILVQPDGKIVLTAVPYVSVPSNHTPAYIPASTVVTRLNADGSMDTAFGTAGSVTISTDSAALTKLALQPDGKIVLAGTAFPTSMVADAEVAVTRLNADGSTDAGYHGGTLQLFDETVYGYTEFSGFGISSQTGPVAGIALNPTGQIVLAWTVTAFDTTPVTVNMSTKGDDYEVAELNGDGTLHTAFGTGGVTRGPGNVGTLINSDYSAMAIQPDGKIVLAGTRVKRLNADGSPDTGFTSQAVNSLGQTTVSVSINAVSSVVIQPDGKILIGGNALDGPIGQTGTVLGFAAERFQPSGAIDRTYNPSGVLVFTVPKPAAITTNAGFPEINALALVGTGQVVAVGSVTFNSQIVVPTGGTVPTLGSQLVLARLLSPPTAVAGDYDGDGRADPAVELTSSATFVIQKSTGGTASQQFGITGVGQTIPDPGDYDGDGKTDVAAYLPSIGAFAYRPSGGGRDVIVPFGTPGAGLTVAAPGDYDGDGKADIAVYLANSGSFVIRPSSGGPDRIMPFGLRGVGASIPAPGDYDGDGKTDLAVYLPSLGVLAYRPSSGGADVLRLFGSKGVGASIPAPGDYDGDGKTDVAVYLPASGSFAVQPSTTFVTYVAQFGALGANQSIPAPGDYDGDGEIDLAVYLPASGRFADRPSAGGADLLQFIGTPGTQQTIPAASIYLPPSASSTTRTARSAAVTVPPAVFIPDLVADPASSAVTGVVTTGPSSRQRSTNRWASSTSLIGRGGLSSAPNHP